MVQNTAYLRRKFRTAPKIIHERLARGLERIGDDVVSEMQVLNPLPADIKIAWTWGDAPRGSITIGQVSKTKYEKMSITIYAEGFRNSKGGFVAPGWYEFGTNLRVQKTTGRQVGLITAQPFFYPVYRGNKSKIKSRLNGILRRAVKRANQLR